MNPMIMKRPMFRMGGSARPGYRDSNFSDLLKDKKGLRESILKDIGAISDARAERIGAQRSLIPLSLLAQQEGISQIRKPMDLVNLLSALGTDQRTFQALGKLEDLDLKLAKGSLDDKLAALKVMDSKDKKFDFERRLEAYNSFQAAQKKLLEGVTDEDARAKIKSSSVYRDLETKKNFVLRQMTERGYLLDAMSRRGDSPTFDLADEVERFKEFQKMRGNLATGGRVGFQDGTPNPEFTMPEPKPREAVQDRQLDTLMKAAPALEDPNQAKSMGEGDMYAALRRRLPQEITDDVVRLIAYNPQAFADFADIQDQSEVDSFNQKYNVQLVLPVENVT